MTDHLKDYHFIKLERERVKDLVYLFKGAYGADRSEDDFLKMHLNCHGEHKFIGFIAYDKKNNEPAAYHGVFPVYMTHESGRFLAAQVGDTMTHPNHQRKGLYITVAKIVYEYCRTIGIHLIFSFPNEKSYPGRIKYLDFTEMPPLRNITLLENKLELCRITSKSKLLSELHERYIRLIFRIFTKPGKTFPNSNSNLKNAVSHVLHDEQFFRQKEKPESFFIQINGVDVWMRTYQNQLTIGDINSSQSNVIFKTVQRLKIIAFLCGSRFLSTGGTSNSFLISLLTRFGFKSSDSYKLLILNLSSTISLTRLSFLSADADVF